MGHVTVGRRWERVAMDLLDMSITSAKGNRYVLVMVDCFSRWTEAFRCRTRPSFRWRMHSSVTLYADLGCLRCDSFGPRTGI